MSPTQNRFPLEDRVIEFDGLAITVLILAFIGVSAAAFWIISAAAQNTGALTYIVSALIGLGIALAWIVGYPRRSAMPAMALVIVCALAWLPYIFRLDGALLRDSGGTPVSHLYLVAGLYVGGVGLVLLALSLVGFIAPLIGAILAVRQGRPGAHKVLALHVSLLIASVAILTFSRVVGMQ